MTVLGAIVYSMLGGRGSQIAALGEGNLYVRKADGQVFIAASATLAVRPDFNEDPEWIAERLRIRNREVIVTREPGGTLLAEKLRALVLAEDPLRCQSLPHMTLAGWDLLELIMESNARDYPQWFSLHKAGNQWHWINRPLGIDQKFTFLDDSTLPYGPMEYITRQMQGDFTLQDERDANLWVDAGMVTTQADWSLDFDVGMNFFEWHAPVPLAPAFTLQMISRLSVDSSWPFSTTVTGSGAILTVADTSAISAAGACAWARRWRA